MCDRQALLPGQVLGAKTRHAAVSCRHRTFAPQRGQALLETVVGALALVPLVLLVVWLGKVQSLRQAVISASRIVAFECTVRPQECADPSSHAGLADEIRRRSFSRVDTAVLSLDRSPDLASAPYRNPLWVDRGNRPLLERFSDVGVRVDRERFDAGLSLAQSRAAGLVVDASNWLADKAGPGRFGLQIGDGLIDAKVQANMSASVRHNSFESQLDSIPLRLKAHTAILTDAWNASGPTGALASSVESRVRLGQTILQLYEASLDARYLPVRGFIDLMNLVGLEPRGDAFRYHQSDVSVVPPDRLPMGGELPQYGSADTQTGDGGW
jgi:hypothetical protein